MPPTVVFSQLSKGWAYPGPDKADKDKIIKFIWALEDYSKKSQYLDEGKYNPKEIQIQDKNTKKNRFEEVAASTSSLLILAAEPTTDGLTTLIFCNTLSYKYKYKYRKHLL